MKSLLIDIFRKFRSALGQTPERLSLQDFKRKTPFLIRDYLRNSDVKKLHIGCQSHPMLGWLNVDIEPKTNGIAYMDATCRFPLPDGCLDYVFSEHMIEHIGLPEGIFMLKECYRVMKKDGVIRIVTPNLKFIVELYNSVHPVHSEYVSFSERYFKSAPPPFINDTVVINNFFRDWGHQFIYDEKSLHAAFATVGFQDIKTEELYISRHPDLTGLEKHHLEITDKFNKLESLVVEAVKK